MAMIQLRRMFRFISIPVGNLILGAIAGGACGLSLGWFLGLGYQRQGPHDPGDAPVYVTMGLIMVGLCVGAIVGLIIGIRNSVRLPRRTTITTG